MIFRNKEYTLLIENRASIIIYKFLISLKYKPKKFILPVNICPVVYEAFQKAFVEVEFVDIDSNDLCINKSDVLKRIKNEEYSGILFNYSYGLRKDFTTFFNILKRQKAENFVIIEDKCLCKPEFNGIVGLSSDLLLYSTGYSKYVELNYGGYGFLQNDSKLDLETYNSINGNIIFEGGSEIDLQQLNFSHAEYFNKVESNLASISTHKEELNKLYFNYLNPAVKTLGNEYNDWRFNIEVENKDKLMERIFKSGLFASSHYKPIISDSVTFPNAYKLSNNILNLFNDFHFTKEQVIKISKVINDSF